MSSEPHLLAQVVFFGSDRGGREIPPQSGFHPQLEVGEHHTSCVVEAVVSETTVMPFDIQHEVQLTLLFPEQYVACLADGSRMRLFEGSKVIGEGVVTEVLANH